MDNLTLYDNVRTLSIAFPSSIFDNTPTPQLEAYLVGQVARAAVVFRACEIIIYDEDDTNPTRTDRLVKLFEYAECPQYLRKRLFAIEPDLKYAGLINPLEAQHHLRTSQIECPYREGVTIKYAQYEHKGMQKEATEVNIGLNKSVFVEGKHELHVRVTTKVDPLDLKKMQALLGQANSERADAIIVPPVEPVAKLNLYWGYYVRRASSLSQVMATNTFVASKKDFYDLIVGTSERGDLVDEVTFKKTSGSGDSEHKSKRIKNTDFQHVLVVFGGVRGLEHSAACDETTKNCTDVSKLFDYYINTCPNQGSTTIRTEEAILITLSALRPKLNL